jgi:hypothetical protein
MAQFAYRFKVDIGFIPDGQGGMQVPSSQFLRFEVSSNNPLSLTLGSGDAAAWAAPIAGGATPTAAQIATALQGIATDIQAQLNANGGALLARLQAFATGSG